MKRLLLIMTVVLAGITTATAQRGLAVAKPFDSARPYHQTATRIWVEGKELAPYHLTLYRSITVKNNPDAFSEMERAVSADAKKALSKEIGHVGTHLYYAFLCLQGDGKQPYRYIFYRNASLREGGANEATLVYMEGYATMEELKQMFSQEK